MIKRLECLIEKSRFENLYKTIFSRSHALKILLDLMIPSHFLDQPALLSNLKSGYINVPSN